MRLALLAIALAAPLATAAAAQDKPALAPSTSWTLDYDTDSCALRRMFGEGDKRAYLELRRFQPGLGLQAVVASSWMQAKSRAEFKYRLNDAGAWLDTGGNVLKMDGWSGGVLFAPTLVYLPETEEMEALERDAYLKSIDWQARETSSAAAADTLTLRGAFRSDLSLKIGSLDKPMAALNQCIDELMTHWGIDVEAHKALTRPAVPLNLPEVPRMIDYPPKMLRQFMPGVVNIRLAIDETGRITACHIQMPLSDPAFEETSCADIQHALEFDPALDKDGKPIPSYWVTRVVFQLSR